MQNPPACLEGVGLRKREDDRNDGTNKTGRLPTAFLASDRLAKVAGARDSCKDSEWGPDPISPPWMQPQQRLVERAAGMSIDGMRRELESTDVSTQDFTT